MGKRHEWEFRFVAEQLVTACAERILYHERRVERLTQDLAEKNERRIELLSDTTALLPVYAPSAPGTQTYLTTLEERGMGETRQIAGEMGDLRRRIDDHQMKLRDYRDWRHLFQLDLSAVYRLTYEDVAFFFDHIGGQDA